MGIFSNYLKSKKKYEKMETPEQKMEENINMKQETLEMGVLVMGQKGTEVLVPQTKENEELRVERNVQVLLDALDIISFDKNDEEILVFDSKAFDSIYSDIPEEGVFTLGNDIYAEQDLLEFLDSKWNQYGSVQRRGDMEEDKNYKQVIPSMIIKQEDKYFTYTRLEGGGESRLHGKSSITVGGHANDVEDYWNFEHLMAVNAKRELEEEVYILDSNNEEIDNHLRLTKNMSVKGLIYNEKTDVDAVHIGLLTMIEIPSDWNVKVKETDVLEGKFRTVEEIKELDLENWTASALSVLQ
ncbi:hypothetical protein vBSscSF1_109 [Staphylococcus phage vB-SscS-F1]|nr:hypothetical protein vBApySJF1_109 [Arcanobacterium phage vB-ApyS-JF1]